MISGKSLLAKPRKLSYISDSKKDTINCCDLQQLLYWYDETELHHTKGNFLLAVNREIIIFPNMGYNFYTGRAYTPLQILTDELKIPYRDSLYLLNYFYYKVKKEPLNAALTGWTAKSYAERCATGKNGNLDFGYISKENLFTSPDSTIRTAAIRRAIAYLCQTRGVEKDIVLNLIKQGFLMMDKSFNLYFITYADPITKGEIIAITKKGTTERRFCPNYTKEFNTGFLYGRKPNLEAEDFKELFVFESPVDMLSFMTLVQEKKLLLEDYAPSAAYISLNGVGNHAYITKVLDRYPSIERMTLCLDNDTKGIEAAAVIEGKFANRCEVQDFQPLVLRTLSGKADSKGGFTYYKDYNDLLVQGASLKLAV